MSHKNRKGGTRRSPKRYNLIIRFVVQGRPPLLRVGDHVASHRSRGDVGSLPLLRCHSLPGRQEDHVRGRVAGFGDAWRVISADRDRAFRGSGAKVRVMRRLVRLTRSAGLPVPGQTGLLSQLRADVGPLSRPLADVGPLSRPLAQPRPFLNRESSRSNVID